MQQEDMQLSMTIGAGKELHKLGLYVRQHLLWVVLVAGIVIIHLFDAKDVLAYERISIEHGQLWRLITAHFVHLGTGHLLENSAGVIVVAMVCGSMLTTSQWIQVLATNMLSISSLLLLLNGEVAWYVGLSGVLYGALFAGLVAGLSSREARRWSLFLLVAATLRIGAEMAYGPSHLSVDLTGGAVVVEAHLYGAMSGLIVGLFMSRYRNMADVGDD